MLTLFASPSDRISLRQELEATRRAILAELRELDSEALHLKTTYQMRFDALEQITAMECSFDECEQVRTAWRVFLKKRDAALRQFYAVNQRLAAMPKEKP